MFHGTGQRLAMSLSLLIAAPALASSVLTGFPETGAAIVSLPTTKPVVMKPPAITPVPYPQLTKAFALTFHPTISRFRP